MQAWLIMQQQYSPMDLNKKQTSWVPAELSAAAARSLAAADEASLPPGPQNTAAESVAASLPPAPRKNDTAAESLVAAKEYLHEVDSEFCDGNRQQIARGFRDILREMNEGGAALFDLIKFVLWKFYVNERLLLGFNSFLPQGCDLEIMTGPRPSEMERYNRAGHVATEIVTRINTVHITSGISSLMAAAVAVDGTKGSGDGAPPVQTVSNSNQVVVTNAPVQEARNQVALLTNQGSSVVTSNRGATAVVAENKRLLAKEKRKKQASKKREMRHFEYVNRTIDNLGELEQAIEIEYLDLTPEVLNTLNGAEIVGKKVNNAKDVFKWKRGRQLSQAGRIERRRGSGSLVASTLETAVVVQPHDSIDRIAIDSNLIKKNNVCWCKTSAAQKSGAIANQLTGAIVRDNGVGYCLVYYQPSGEYHWANENYITSHEKKDRKSKPPDFFGYADNQIQSNDDKSGMEMPTVSSHADRARLNAVYDESRAKAKESPIQQAVREVVSDEKMCKGEKKTDVERLANANLVHETLNKAYSGYVSKHTDLEEALGGGQPDLVSSMANLGVNAEMSHLLVQHLIIFEGEDYDEKKPPQQPTAKPKCQVDGCSSYGHTITKHKFCFKHAPPESKKKCLECKSRLAVRHGQRCKKCTPSDKGKEMCPGCNVRLPREVGGYCSTCISRLPVSVRRACRKCKSEDRRIGEAGGLCSKCFTRSKHA